MKTQEIIKKLHEMANPENVEGMARFGINPENNLGIRVTDLRKLVKNIGKNHQQAQELWETQIHDARMLAAHIDEPEKVTIQQMETWAKDFDSWDIVDNCCGHLFDKTKHKHKIILKWSSRPETYVKRAAFSLIAWSAVHDKKKDDKIFEEYLKIIKRESTDERNYVKKAVNWALRSIGKRNWDMNKKAKKISEEILKINNRTARWIAQDALRELNSEKIKEKLDRIQSKQNP